MADRACYKSPLDLWCSTFSLNSKVTFFILIINASQITKTSEHRKSPLIWFRDAHTYLFSLMRCCPYLPPLSLFLSLSLSLVSSFSPPSLLLHAPRIQELRSISSSTPPTAWHHLPVLLLDEVSGRAWRTSVSPSLWRTGGVNSLCFTAGVHAK